MVLLQYCARHPDGRQTQTILSRETGIPQPTICQILKQARADRNYSLLARVACKYRFDFELSIKPNRILDAVYMGYG